MGRGIYSSGFLHGGRELFIGISLCGSDRYTPGVFLGGGSYLPEFPSITEGAMEGLLKISDDRDDGNTRGFTTYSINR